MDIKVLSHLLQQLIISNNKVLLPGLGSFIIEEMPSSLLNDGATITAPYSAVLFKNFEIRNDGILEEAYVRESGLSNDESRKEINLIVSEIKKRLIADSKIEFPGFGTLSFSAGFQFVFVPDKDFFDNCNIFGSEIITLAGGEDNYVFANNTNKSTILKKESTDMPGVGMSGYSKSSEAETKTETEVEIETEAEVETKAEFKTEVVTEPEVDVNESEQMNVNGGSASENVAEKHQVSFEKNAVQKEEISFDLADEPIRAVVPDNEESDFSAVNIEVTKEERKDSEQEEKEETAEKEEKEEKEEGVGREEVSDDDFERELSAMIDVAKQKEVITINNENLNIDCKTESGSNPGAAYIEKNTENFSAEKTHSEEDMQVVSDDQIQTDANIATEALCTTDCQNESDSTKDGAQNDIDNIKAVDIALTEEEKTEQKKETKTTKILKIIFIILVVIALMLVLATLIYLFKEPLKPLLERIFYSKEEIDMVHSLGL